jgi:hypothetical protein
MLTAFSPTIGAMQHPDTLTEVARQRHADLLLRAEQRRLRSPDPTSERRPLLAVAVELQLPSGRRLRFSAGRIGGGFSTRAA